MARKRGEYKAYLPEPTCGHEGCVIHRFTEEVVRNIMFEKHLTEIIHTNYTPAEMTDLWQASRGLGR